MANRTERKLLLNTHFLHRNCTKFQIVVVEKSCIRSLNLLLLHFIGEECQMWNTYYRNYFLELQDFIGEKPKDKRDPKYKLYYMARGEHQHLGARKEHTQMRAEHNYCRGFVHSYLHPNQVRPPECVRISANRFYNKRVAKPGKELVPCDVPICSQCMYGDGKGNFPPYTYFRGAGAYNGTVRETFRR